MAIASTQLLERVKQQVKTQSVKPAGRPRVERIIVQPTVGTPVHWYVKADPTDKPAPAIVTEVFEDRVSLWVFNAGGRQQFDRKNVPHLSDPILTVKRDNLGGEPLGAWDFNPDFVPERFRGLDAIRYRIVLLHKIHAYNPYQIAHALGGPWSEKAVQEVLDQDAQGFAGKDEK